MDDDFCETDRLHEVLETKAASSLVAESDQLHAVSECTAASSLVAETERLHEVLECTAASSFAAETDQLHAESESSCARVWHPVGHSAWRSRVGGLRLRRQAHCRSGNLLWILCRHLTMLTTSTLEVLVAHMVSMSCMVHARIHVWSHMLHA